MSKLFLLRQQRDFAAALAAAGARVEAVEVPRRHRFDVIHDLAEPGTRLNDLVRARLGL